jgi:hypothetical protein
MTRTESSRMMMVRNSGGLARVVRQRLRYATVLVIPVHRTAGFH